MEKILPEVSFEHQETISAVSGSDMYHIHLYKVDLVNDVLSAFASCGNWIVSFLSFIGGHTAHNLLLDSGSGVSDDSGIETAPLITQRHLSYPAAATQPYHNIERSHSFMPSIAKSSWNVLNEAWNEKWYKS